MNKDLTYLLIIVDASGSMNSIKDDAQGGINDLLQDQAKQEGECIVTLMDFASHGDERVIFDGVNAKNCGSYTLKTRGMTALNDAIGKSVNDLGAKLAKMPENERPGLVTVAIVTDGGENDSKEFTTANIKAIIDTQENEFSWKFTYLGANQDSFAEAGKLGINTAGIGNYAAGKIKIATQNLSSNVSRMRGATRSGVEVKCSYTAEELSNQS